jgi:DNA-binding Xre family transcriptional regulator
MSREMPEGLKRGLRELAEEPLSPGHKRRTIENARARLEKREEMFRWTRRFGFAGAAFALLAAGMIFIPVSYNVCVGSVVEAEWTAAQMDEALTSLELDDEMLIVLRGKEAELREKAEALREKADELGLKEKELQNLERGAALLEQNLEKLCGRLETLHGMVHTSLSEEDGSCKLWLYFAGKRASEAEEMAALTLDHLPQVLGSPGLASKEIRMQIGGNVLAWATGGRIVIHAEGLSPEELEAKIEEEFLRRGAKSADAEATIQGDSLSVIRIEVGEAPADMFEGDSLTIEITN